MRNLLYVIFLLSASLAAQDLKLIPVPQSVTPGVGKLMLKTPVRIGVASHSAADRFAAGLLAEDLKQFAHLRTAVLTGSGKGFAIVIGKPGTPAIDAEIKRLKLDTPALDHGESYLLSISNSGVLVAAKTDEGVFYGVQTLRQLVHVGKDGAFLPHVTIADWPAMRYRGLCIDISQGGLLTEEQIKLAIRRLSSYKMNMLSLYIEHLFPFKSSPMVAPEGGEFPAELMKRLVAYAEKFHVDIVPQQQTFGHLQQMLKYERYADMAELPHGSVLAAESQQGYDWIREASAEMAASTKSKFFHIGSDETWDLGKGRSKAAAERAGVGQVYMDHVRKVAELLKPLNRTLMFWGDIALDHPELVPTLPKDMVAMTWDYEPRADFDKYILPFKNAGMQFFVCPGVSNWNRVFPNFTKAVTNINNFVRDGKKYGALGMFNTEWADDGESLFNMCWYGNLFGAAAAWQKGVVDVSAFDQAFDWAFYRHESDTFATAVQQFNRIHGLLVSAGVGDGNDELTWFDPFSKLGAERVRQIGPIASEIRKLAEDAYIRVTAAEPGAAMNQDTLAYVRFAAKRFDYVGMRVQYAQDMAQLYRNKRARAASDRAADLLAYINELKLAYRNLWLAEDRPHWIENVMIRFENEALYWEQKRRLLAMAEREYRATKALPEPESLGLILP